MASEKAPDLAEPPFSVAKLTGCKKLSLFHCRLTMLNWLALTRIVNHSNTRGQVQCTVSWCIIGLHQENEARLKMFTKVQIKLVALDRFWGSVSSSVGTEEHQSFLESHQENQVY